MAGTPPTRLLSGTSFVTTAPAATITLFPRTDLSNLHFDTVVTAVYRPYVTTLASSALRQGRPVLLAEGKFHEGDTITTGAVSSPLSLTETVVEAWILTIPVGGGSVDHTIRWLMPDPNGHYAVYLLQGGNWVRIKAESFGSYRSFPIVGGGTIAITESPGLPGWGWAAGAGTLALIAGVVRAFGRHCTRPKPPPNNCRIPAIGPQANRPPDGSARFARGARLAAGGPAALPLHPL